MKHILTLVNIFLFIALISHQSNGQNSCLSAEEVKLHRLINEYRAQKGLPSIPLSAELSKVAQAHVRDLQNNIGELTHGWSDCPYEAGDESTYYCMWEQPQKRTTYKGYGYECAFWSSDAATAAGALASWKTSKFHNDVIINKSTWQNLTWKAIGIGIYKQYAVIWFGEDADNVKVEFCK
jgi:uncharacterized protein YkwD